MHLILTVTTVCPLRDRPCVASPTLRAANQLVQKRGAHFETVLSERLRHGRARRCHISAEALADAIPFSHARMLQRSRASSECVRWAKAALAKQEASKAGGVEQRQGTRPAGLAASATWDEPSRTLAKGRTSDHHQRRAAAETARPSACMPIAWPTVQHLIVVDRVRTLRA